MNWKRNSFLLLHILFLNTIGYCQQSIFYKTFDGSYDDTPKNILDMPDGVSSL